MMMIDDDDGVHGITLLQQSRIWLVLGRLADVYLSVHVSPVRKPNNVTGK